MKLRADGMFCRFNRAELSARRFFVCNQALLHVFLGEGINNINVLLSI